MKEQLEAKFKAWLKHENELGHLYQVSVRKPKSMTWWAWWKVQLIVQIAILTVSIVFGIQEHYFLAFASFTVGEVLVIRHLIKRIRGRLKPAVKPYQLDLIEFMLDNKFYTTDLNGQLETEMSLFYVDYGDYMSVFVKKNGDRYQKVANQLGDLLESKLGLTLYETKEDAVSVEYCFLKFEIQRKEISALPVEDDSLEISVYGDFKVSLRDNYSMLVSGASGAGKSYYTYFYLTSFISQIVDGKHARLYGIDPKQSDLYTLFKQSKMPAENYGTSVADAFRIVRAYTEEMNKRIEAYSESGAFNSVALDLGYPPALLILEEYSSLVATMDSKQKKEFENMVAVIAQKSRQLSMGLLIVMQQPRADSLSTNIREQLQNAVFLGNPSKESAQMMFGTSDVPTVNGTGAGLYSIEREAPKAFESPMFGKDVFEVILPVWQAVAESYQDEMVRAKYGIDEPLDQAPKKEPSPAVQEQNLGEVDWKEFL